MSHKRMIYEDMFEDNEIGMLPREARLLWVGLIVALADDQGRILDNLSLIRNKAFMFDPDISLDDIAKWLDMLENIGCIYRYKKDGKDLIQIVKWWDYQTPSWANESKFLPPDGWIDKVKVHEKGNKVKMINWDTEGGFQTNVPTDVPTSVPTQEGRGINDVNVKGDGDGDVNGDDDVKTAAAAVSDTEPKNSDVAEIFQVYEQEIGAITSFTREEVLDVIERYPRDWIIEAIKEAVKNNVRKWSYVRAILESWKVNGYKTDVRSPKKYSASSKKVTSENNEERLKQFRTFYKEQKQDVPQS